MIERELETLSPPSDADAPNEVKVVNVLPPGQKFTYTVMAVCKSRASAPKMHSGNSPRSNHISTIVDSLENTRSEERRVF